MSKIIDLDSIGNEFDVSVKIDGKEYKAKEPSLSMVESMSKLDSVPESEHIGIIREFVKKALPDAPEKLIDDLSLRQANGLMEQFMEAIKEDPTAATEAN